MTTTKEAAMAEAKKTAVRRYRTEQAWHHDSDWIIAGRQVRVRIDRDSYDFQCSAIAEVFDPGPAKWNVVASIPYPLMASCATVKRVIAGETREYNLVSYGRPLDNEAAAALNKDEAELIARVQELLG